jgi:hypothetical protein
MQGTKNTAEGMEDSEEIYVEKTRCPQRPRVAKDSFSRERDGLLLSCYSFQVLVIKIDRMIKGIHPDAFIFAVGADIIPIDSLT